MLMNHKNFRYTQIPDKTNAMISLESSKTVFGSFLPDGDVYQKLQLCHTTVYGPLTPC